MAQTLLTIEDETGIRESICYYFEDQGFEVIKANNGRDGLALFRQAHPDVVLVDLRMPGINGLDVIAAIKQESPDTPIIVVSGTGVLADAINAIRLGAWDYVTKPIDDMEVLEHIVGKALERARFIRQNREHQKCLEQEVWKRTQELRETNGKLMEEIHERVQAERQIVEYQNQLRALVSQLTLSEERERKHLATLVHDNLSQSIAIMKMKVDSLFASDITPEIKDFLSDMQDMLIDVIAQTQQITKDLGSPLLHELGFKAAVEEWLHSDIEKKYGLKTSVKDQGCPPIDEETAAILFRAIRELSINVVKHAQARHLSVTLDRYEDQIKVRVSDDGIGFDPASLTNGAATNGGYGLFSIKERIDYMDGLFEVSSRPGNGTDVIMMVPLNSLRGMNPVPTPEGP